MELVEVTAREANQRFSALLAAIEKGGPGFIVTKRGRPVARITPVQGEPRRLTPEQEAALARLLSSPGFDLGGKPFVRDEAYDRPARGTR